MTGDIAFSAIPDEYAAADAWLGSLLEGLGLGPERLLVVPGNHDVNRKARGDREEPAYTGYRARPALLDRAFERPALLEALWPKHVDYQRFAQAYGSPPITAACPFWRAPLEAARMPPVFAVGLNTTLLSFDGTDDPRNLALGSAQIQRAFEGLPDDALVLLLQHHPPGWLVDGEDLLRALPAYAHVLFSGHVHLAGGFVQLPIGGRGIVQLVAGAGHADAGEAGAHAYAWGALHAGGLDYLPRVWSPDDRMFVPRRVNAPREETVYDPPLGEYTRVPGARLPQPLKQWLAQCQGARSGLDARDIGGTGIPSAAAEPARQLETALSTIEKVKQVATRGSLREVWEAVDMRAPAPGASPFPLTPWLGSVVLVLVIVFGVLMSTFQAGTVPMPDWTGVRDVIDYFQFFVVLVLLVLVVRAAPPPALRAESESSESCERGVRAFNRLWKGLWCGWCGTYLTYSVEHLWPDTNALSLAARYPYVTLIEHCFIHFTNAMLFLLFWEMYRPTRSVAVKGSERTWSMKRRVLLVGCVLAAAELGVVLWQQKPFTASLWIGLLGGCISALCLGLFVGRLESRYLDLDPIEVVVLYGYAAIQPLFSLSTMGRVITITEGLSLVNLQVVIKLLAIAFKLAIFFSVSGRVESGRLAFYMWKARGASEDMPSEWALFQRDRLASR